MSVFKQFNFPAPLFKKQLPVLPWGDCTSELEAQHCFRPRNPAHLLLREGLLCASSASASTVAVIIDFSFTRRSVNIGSLNELREYELCGMWTVSLPLQHLGEIALQGARAANCQVHYEMPFSSSIIQDLGCDWTQCGGGGAAPSRCWGNHYSIISLSWTWEWIKANVQKRSVSMLNYFIWYIFVLYLNGTKRSSKMECGLVWNKINLLFIIH